MALIQAFTGALGGTFADQWKEIITVDPFDELTAVSPAVVQRTNYDRGTNFHGSDGIISNGSKIFVPENTAAFIYSQSGIEEVITTPGGYEYQNGQKSIFNKDSLKETFIDQVASRFAFGGQPSEQKLISFVNKREMRGIKFGTRGPLIYNDLFYGTDLEIIAFGSFSIRITDVEKFIRNFVPANIHYYSFAKPDSRRQLVSEFIQSFTVALNSLSSTHRVSQLPSQSHNVVDAITATNSSAGTWPERFGLGVVNVGIENIEFTPESRELVKQYSTNLMNLKAYEGISQHSSNVSAQQKIAGGVESHGLGDAGGMLFGMGLAQELNPQTAAHNSQPIERDAPTILSIDEQIENVRKLKELLDEGLLTEEEFEIKKKEVMGFSR